MTVVNLAARDEEENTMPTRCSLVVLAATITLVVAAPAEDWTAKRAYANQSFKRDHAIED